MHKYLYGISQIFIITSILVTLFYSLMTRNHDTAFISLAALFLLMLPLVLSRRIGIEIPRGMQFIIAIFIYASLFLGEIRQYYVRYPYWDLLLHMISGFLIGAIGFSLVDLLNKSDKVSLSMSPVLTSLFACCFAVTIGCLWEIFEFVMDQAFGFNMQKDTLLADGGTDIGLIDTMEDLIVDVLGALLSSLLGFFYLKKGEFYKLKGLLLKLKEKHE
jgi:uncharacterized membrane protein YjdF